MAATQAGARRLAAFYRRHEGFLLVLLLAVAFRLMAIWLLRPGGFIVDNSDFEYYDSWGGLTASGYRAFADLWSAYPPLFARLMLPIWELSARIPPWEDPRLAFHILFASFLLLFEIGNLILIYRLAGKLAADEIGRAAVPGNPFAAPFAEGPGVLAAPLHPVLFYALLFVPVYTLLGFFDLMPLFFLLLGLDLLLGRARGSWAASAVAVGLGFLVKLTPIVLLPVAVRWLGARLSWEAARREWFNPRSPGNLLRPALYALITAATIAGFGYWLGRGNLTLALSSFRINAIRPPWQSVWALLDGYWGFGLVPLDMRNLDGLARDHWQTGLPWMWISLGFAALFLFLYTRRYDWERPRTAIAVAGVSLILLLLYSKGWSPQFLVWVLAFMALLTPGGRGVLLAVALSLLNLAESFIYMILLPDERWILVGTVTLRTLLLAVVAADFLGQIWPAPRRAWLQRAASLAAAAGLLATLLFGVLGAPRALQAYADRRLAENPCRATIAYLQEDAGGVTRRIATANLDAWRALYPWLRHDYTLRVIDGYDAADRPADAVRAERLAAFAGDDEFWWLTRTELASPTGDLPRAALPGLTILETRRLDACTLLRAVWLDAERKPVVAQVAGGPILLEGWRVGPARSGQPDAQALLPLVLYWRAEAPVAEPYTVFTHLLDADGRLLAQQDNPPVRGQAPTDGWQPRAWVRDPYMLWLPEDAGPGPYRLRLGLYDAGGARAPLVLPDGSTADAFEITVDWAQSSVAQPRPHS